MCCLWLYRSQLTVKRGAMAAGRKCAILRVGRVLAVLTHTFPCLGGGCGMQGEHRGISLRKGERRFVT